MIGTFSGLAREGHLVDDDGDDDGLRKGNFSFVFRYRRRCRQPEGGGPEASTFNVQRPTFNIQRPTFNIQRPTFKDIPHEFPKKILPRSFVYFVYFVV